MGDSLAGSLLEDPMKRLYYASLTYMIVGIASGLFYRELTKFNEFEGDTQLAVAHTHLLVLGMFFFLIVIALEKLFTLSDARTFRWFFWTYNAGVIVTVSMQIVHGSMTVLGHESGPAIAGIAGMGHIFITIGLVLMFIALKGRLIPTTTDSDATLSAQPTG